LAGKKALRDVSRGFSPHFFPSKGATSVFRKYTVNYSGYHIQEQKQNGAPIFKQQLQEYLT
jgi:hypothetical protein